MMPSGDSGKPKHFAQVGGTASVASLREVRPHRNAQTKAPQKSVVRGKPGRRSSSTESMTKERTCDLCTRVQRHWKESEGLQKKTTFSDVTVRSSDGQLFYCNSFVLLIWSKSLLRNAKRRKGPKGEEEWLIQVGDYPAAVMAPCLRYLYGGSVIDLPVPLLPDLVNLAETYHMEDVKEACFSAAEVGHLTVEDACALWVIVISYKLPVAEDRCMRFIYTNLERVVADPTWAKVSHNVEMLLSLFEATAKWTRPNEHSRASQRERTMPTALKAGIRAVWRDSEGLREPHAYSDVLISTKGGAFHVHTQLIYATAPTFASYLHEETESNDSNQVVMDDMDEDVVNEFLRFIYCQEPTSSFSKLAEFVHVLASTHQVSDLVRLCERETAGQELKSVDAALQLLREAEEHRMKATKSLCFRYLYENAEELRDRQDWEELVHDEPQLITEMMLESKYFRHMKDHQGN